MSEPRNTDKRTLQPVRELRAAVFSAAIERSIDVVVFGMRGLEAVGFAACLLWFGLQEIGS